MSRRVLVPLTNSTLAMRALEYALDEWPTADLTAIHVIDPHDAIYGAGIEDVSGAEAWYEAEREAAETLFDRAASSAAAVGVDLQTETVVGDPSREIVRYVDSDIDHVVMGSHGRDGLARLALGSVAEQVVRRADATVTVVR
ncbi:universal stress protein [Haloplanus sp. C73]|uniref:universal stress protein n=1 Tax=Haloplanus sp. C73 TaxID=3421641 RepID=UPI003EB93571